ncbi:MAG: gamma-glutamyl-gamma-aminobutyrate hydrolase family protein [Acidobacteriota bacterium]
MAKVWVLQHLAAEPLGTIGDALEVGGIEAEYIRVFAGEPVPNDMNGASGLVVLGGPMAVYEQAEYPFLSREIRLIESALKADKPVLGICLGSQLLASALGAVVRRAESQEIGWFEVTLTEAAKTDRLFSEVARSFRAYHWHGDVFELPGGAAALASSAQTPVQAFAYGKSAYGVLFHLEATRKIVEDMVRGFAGELDEEKIDAAEIIDQTREHLPQLQRIGSSVFQRWASLIEGWRGAA